MKRVDVHALELAAKAEHIIGKRIDEDTRKVIATAFRIGYRQALVEAAKQTLKGDKRRILMIADEEVPNAG